MDTWQLICVMTACTHYVAGDINIYTTLISGSALKSQLPGHSVETSNLAPRLELKSYHALTIKIQDEDKHIPQYAFPKKRGRWNDSCAVRQRLLFVGALLGVSKSKLGGGAMHALVKISTRAQELSPTTNRNQPWNDAMSVTSAPSSFASHSKQFRSFPPHIAALQRSN